MVWQYQCFRSVPVAMEYGFWRWRVFIVTGHRMGTGGSVSAVDLHPAFFFSKQNTPQVFEKSLLDQSVASRKVHKGHLFS